MNEPGSGNNGSSPKAYRIIAGILALLLATAVIFFAVKLEQKKIAGSLKKNRQTAQERAAAGGELGLKEGNKIYSSQWTSKNTSPGTEPLSARDSAAFIAYEKAYAADSEKSANEKNSAKIAGSKRAADSAKAAIKAARIAKTMDSLKKANAAASSGSGEGPARNQVPIDCRNDTVTPEVYPDSAGGEHIGPAHVFLRTNKPCTVFWRFDPDTSWHVWNADTFVMDCTATLGYKAVDRCGRATEPRRERYDIKPFGFVPAAGPELPPADCANDTMMPWVYPDPAGGLHYGPIHICFQTNKPCTVYWRTGADTAWRAWHSDTFLVDTTTTFTYKAVDRCGHAMEPQEESYVIRPRRSTFPCGTGMEPVETDAKQFCIDRYEWPDRKGATPQTYVSLYQAMDSCAAAGKRLCTADEWSLACAGPDSLSYPYGRRYSRHACVTHDTTMRHSGSKPECRAFFGAYDMSGNVAEWTSTPSKRNAHFYNVMGGFWASGPASGCYEARYSYYPQNRHNPVGFRCCKDFASSVK